MVAWTSPNGRFLAAPLHGGSIWIWHTEQGLRVNTFSVSMNGSPTVQFAWPDPKSDLVWRARDGKITRSIGQPGLRWQVTLAPDESAAAIHGRGPSGVGGIELWRFGASSAVDLTPGGAHVLDAVWSPNSRSIAYQIYGSERPY